MQADSDEPRPWHISDTCHAKMAHEPQVAALRVRRVSLRDSRFRLVDINFFPTIARSSSASFGVHEDLKSIQLLFYLFDFSPHGCNSSFDGSKESRLHLLDFSSTIATSGSIRSRTTLFIPLSNPHKMAKLADVGAPTESLDEEEQDKARRESQLNDDTNMDEEDRENEEDEQHEQDEAEDRMPIPVSLRQLFPHDGDFTLISIDLGTGYTCIYSADGVAKDGKILMSSKPVLFQDYPDNFNTRPEHLTEIPTLSAYVLSSLDPKTAKHGNGAVVKTGKGVFVADMMKEALYSGQEGADCRKRLAEAALKVPYLVERYTGTNLENNPQVWFLAQFVHWVAALVLESLKKQHEEVAWVLTIPANWNQKSNALYSKALNTSPILHDRFFFQAEVESAIASIVDRNPKASMSNGDIFYVLDAGKGTSVGCSFFPFSLFFSLYVFTEIIQLELIYLLLGL